MKPTPAAKVKRTRSATGPTPQKPRSFTVRELNRATAAVLNAARAEGSVVIHSRDGEEYRVSLVVAEDVPSTGLLPKASFLQRMKVHHEKMLALGCHPFTAKDQARLNAIIAGEA